MFDEIIINLQCHLESRRGTFFTMWWSDIKIVSSYFSGIRQLQKYLSLSNLLKYQSLSFYTRILLSDISIRTFQKRISIILFVVAQSVSRSRTSGIVVAHLGIYFDHIFFIKSIYHISFTLGARLLRWWSTSSKSQLYSHSLKESLRGTLDVLFRCVCFCFRQRTRRSFVLLWLLVLYVEEDVFFPY